VLLPLAEAMRTPPRGRVQTRQPRLRPLVGAMRTVTFTRLALLRIALLPLGDQPPDRGASHQDREDSPRPEG
jgi:hypothetical protein